MWSVPRLALPRGHAGSRASGAALQYRVGERSSDVDCPVFWPEAKRGATAERPGRALRQTTNAAAPGESPSPSSRDDRSEPFER